MKKKLCFVIGSMRRDGAERVMSILVNRAARQGHEVSLILTSTTDVEYELEPSIRIIGISELLRNEGGRLNRLTRRYSTLKRTLLELKPDVVVSFLCTCNIYSALALRGTDIPLIVSERNDPKKECPGKIKRIIRKISYREADGFIFQTEDAKRYFSKKIQRRSVTIPNPVKNGLPLADVEHAEHVVAAAARLTPQKNYPMMLRAFRLFLEEYPDYVLRIYGNGEERETLAALVKQWELSEHVTFEGNVSDLHERIKRAKMFVLSSDFEGISNSLLEATAMGLPAVSTDCPCGGSAMLIENGVSGFLTPVGDEVAFSEAMKKIAASEELAKEFSRNALPNKEKFSEDAIVARYFEFIETVMNKNNR